MIKRRNKTQTNRNEECLTRLHKEMCIHHILATYYSWFEWSTDSGIQENLMTKSIEITKCDRKKIRLVEPIIWTRVTHQVRYGHIT